MISNENQTCDEISKKILKYILYNILYIFGVSCIIYKAISKILTLVCPI